MQDDKSPAPAASFPGMRPRRAAAIALGIGAAAGIGSALAAPDAPWWMPLLLFLLAGAVVWRLLRPPPRRIGWEDEV